MSNLRIPKNRKNSRISFEQFIELRKSGSSLNSIIKTGVSKHQIAFFSSLEQNKIGITKEQMQEEYLSGKSLIEIASKYGIQKDFMVHIREHFGIARLGPKFINRKKTEKSLTYRQKRIIYGSLMGDAGKMSPSSVKMKQSVKQEKYLTWKFRELEEHITDRGIKMDSSYHKVMKKTYSSFIFYTNANTDVENIISKFYNPHKMITENVLKELDELSLAVWFMDDGTTDWGQRSINKGINSKPGCKLCTDSFSLDEVKLICEWFSSRWNIKCNPKYRNENQYRVYFSTTETPKLFALIRPYIIPSMLYKVDYNEYKQQ